MQADPLRIVYLNIILTKGRLSLYASGSFLCSSNYLPFTFDDIVESPLYATSLYTMISSIVDYV